MSEQLALDMVQPISIGDNVYWTPGLKYLCATYAGQKKGWEKRPENVQQVKVIAIDGDRLIIDVPDWHCPIHTCRNWISTDQNVPCDSVLRAYGVYL